MYRRIIFDSFMESARQRDSARWQETVQSSSYFGRYEFTPRPDVYRRDAEKRMKQLEKFEAQRTRHNK
jgi:hypothetical protein